MKLCIDCQAPITGRSKRCAECGAVWKKERMGIYNKEYYAENRERERLRAKEYREQNPELVRLQSLASRQANRENILEQRRLGRIKNKERLRKQRAAGHIRNKERENARSQEYKKANKPELAAKQAQYNRDHPEGNRFRRSLRRAAEKRAMPAWADKSKMFEFYAEAARLTRETGIPHHVDHIYPLQSKVMCGLHCEANMQVIPADLNYRKKNRVPDMTEQPRYCAWPSIVHFEATMAMAA
jgi:hypothetical protein